MINIQILKLAYQMIFLSTLHNETFGHDINTVSPNILTEFLRNIVRIC